MAWFWRKRRIYLDHASATSPCVEALLAMEAAVATFGNPSAIHQDGVAAKNILEFARKKIARTIQCRAEELIFTSGGTEGNNLAILGAITDFIGSHIVVSAIEHPSVLEPVAWLEKQGVKVSRVMPDINGTISARDIERAMTKDTKLVSVGWANSEIGVVQPISKIAATIRDHEKRCGVRVLFHSDAGQAPLYRKGVIGGLGVDLLVLDSGKLYGPRGVGVLFIRHGVNLRPIIFGGGQEKSLRPGTENVALVSGMAAALEASAVDRDVESKRLAKLRTMLIKKIAETLPGAAINTEGAKHVLPHIVNFSIPGIDAEYVALALDHMGVSISTKTSCKEGERESAVVVALGLEPGRASSALRISLGRSTTARDLEKAIDLLGRVVDKHLVTVHNLT